MILTLQTTTFGAHGGIPTYNRLVCRVLNEAAAPERDYVLIATDRASHIETRRAELANLELEAFNQNRLVLIRRLVRLAVTHRIDLVLIGHINYAPLGWLLKRVQPQLRYGVMLYGIEAWQKLPLFKRRALQKADFLISISAYTKQKAVEVNGLNPDLISILPNALEWNDGDEVQATTHASPVGKRLLSVCRLEMTERYKGVDKVIEALPEIARQIPDVRYSVVGGGTDLARHKELAQKVGVAERVNFFGHLPEDELRACYRDCDVFVMPSAGEGFGFVFLEAMRFGKPIVAANSAGAPEVVEDGVTGRLVEYGNQPQLARTLIDLCLDRNSRERLGEAGRQRLQERFMFSTFKKKLTEILAQGAAAHSFRS